MEKKTTSANFHPWVSIKGKAESLSNPPGKERGELLMVVLTQPYLRELKRAALTQDTSRVKCQYQSVQRLSGFWHKKGEGWLIFNHFLFFFLYDRLRFGTRQLLAAVFHHSLLGSCWLFYVSWRHKLFGVPQGHLLILLEVPEDLWDMEREWVKLFCHSLFMGEGHL